MKLVFFLFLLLGLVTAMHLKTESSISLQLDQSHVYIPLEYEGNEGEVTLSVKGLPDGLYLDNQAIKGKTGTKNGYFPILVDAEDSQGTKASKIIVLKIGFNSGLSSSSSGSTTSSQISITTTTTNSRQDSTDSSDGSNIINSRTSGSSVSSNNRNQISSILADLGIPDTSSSSQMTNPSFEPSNIIGGSNSNIIGGSNFGTFSSSPSSNNNLIDITTTRTTNVGNNLNVPQRTTRGTGSLPSTTNLDDLLNQLAPTSGLDANQNLNIRTNIQTVSLNQNNGFTSPNNRFNSPGQPQTFSNFPNQQTAPNVIPNIIRTTQAPRSQANRNRITEDDIQSTSVFERQINANKAIANLLDIVDQLRANVNAAEGDLKILQNQLQNAINFQRNTQAKITAAENKISRLRHAINNMNNKVSILQQQLVQLQNSFQSTTTTITSQQTTIENLNKQIKKYQQILDDLQDMIEETNEALDNVETEIQTIIRSIEDTQIILRKKKEEIQNIDILIDDSVINVLNIDEEINDLKRRLNAAVNRKVQGEREELRLRNLKANAPTQIASLEDDIRMKDRKVEDLQKKKGELLDQIKDLNEEIDTSTENLELLELQVNQFKMEIKVVNGNKRDFDQAIASKNKEIQDAIQTLQYLNRELNPLEQALNAAYREGQEANRAINIAQQNFAAINERWQNDQIKLQNALKNLEKARAQKEVADLAMQQLLQERSEVLPYSVIPNGNGLTNPGSPSGNNPSGSPLGPYTFGASNSLTSIISSVTPSPQSTSTPQYPFSLYRQVQSISQYAPYLGTSGNIVPGLYQGSNGLTYNGNLNCGNNLSHMHEGVIRSIGNNALKISSTNGEVVIGTINSCTSAYGPKPDYTPKIGDKVTFYGESISDGIYNIYSLNCS